MTHRIDVLLPTYEPHPQFLWEAITSLLAQTERDWRLHIQDDASSVNVREMIEPFAKDPRISFARSPVRLGIGANWNTCLRKATAPFLQYLFQDDRYAPTLLERGISILDQHPDVGFVSLGHRYVFTDTLPTSSVYEALENFRREKIQRGLHRGMAFLRWWMARGLHPNVIGEPSFVMLRRATAEKVGPFSETMPQCLDSEYWMRLLLVSDWYSLPDDLGEFRIHRAGASAQNEREGRGLYDRLACLEQLLTMLPEGPDREIAKRALSSAFGGMVKKFFARQSSGRKSASGGMGTVARLALRHPVLLGRGMRHALMKDRSPGS